MEGEVNGMMTYDRRVLRPDVQKWRADIEVSNVSYNLPYCRRSGHTWCGSCMLTGIRLCTTLPRAVRKAPPKWHLKSYIDRELDKRGRRPRAVYDAI